MITSLEHPCSSHEPRAVLANSDTIRSRRESCVACELSAGMSAGKGSRAEVIGMTAFCRAGNCLLQAKTLLAVERCPKRKW